MRTRPVILIAAAVLAAAAGCAGPAGDASAPGAGTASPTTSTPGERENLPVPTTKPPVSPEPSGGAQGEITVTGKVVPGVEPGCRLLQTEGKSYLLVAEGTNLQALREGATVQVRGRIKADMMTTCMEGTPLVVSSVKPA